MSTLEKIECLKYSDFLADLWPSSVGWAVTGKEESPSSCWGSKVVTRPVLDRKYLSSSWGKVYVKWQACESSLFWSPNSIINVVCLLISHFLLYSGSFSESIADQESGFPDSVAFVPQCQKGPFLDSVSHSEGKCTKRKTIWFIFE